MKKRLLSIILTAFLVLSMVPYAAFADSSIVCPACGGSVTKQERRLLTAHDDFFKCDKCGKWAWANKLGSLNLFSVGDQQILEAVDSSGLLNFSFNNGHLISAEKAPSGIGRKDLPGYASDDGTPSVGKDGTFAISGTFSFLGYNTTAGGYLPDGYTWYPGDGVDWRYWYNFNYKSYENHYTTHSGESTSVSSHLASGDNVRNFTGNIVHVYSFVAPHDGYYTVSFPAASVVNTEKNYKNEYVTPAKPTYDTFLTSLKTLSTEMYSVSYSRYVTSYSGAATEKRYFTKGQAFFIAYYTTVSTQFNSTGNVYSNISLSTSAPTWTADVFEDTDSPSLDRNSTIVINNNTWNGNIYVDNSTNLTYIYPEYTTINENGDTITNISTNPIIYNNTTNQYYTYDTVTNNYYYITYETTPTPTPSPSATPAPTWTPGGGATRGGGVGRHPSDTDAADWTLHYYVLNNRRYDAYYALKKTEVDTETKLPWVDNKKYISTTQIPIANGQYTVSVPDGVYWRVWSWDEASQTLTGVNSSNWHSTINNFLFNATGEYIFEFCKADGSDFGTAKDVTLKLKNDKITDYEDGGTVVEEPTPSPSPEPTETPSSSPTPDPDNPDATPTPNPATPTPTPKPSGDSDSNNSGGSSWNPFKWLTDLLKDIVETILKGLWKLLTSIFGFILWLLSLLFKLFPWMPNSGILALCAGVVVVTVIRIIKFITGR